MVKHTLKTIRRQKPTNCLSVFDRFVGLALKGLNKYWWLVNFDNSYSNIFFLQDQHVNQEHNSINLVSMSSTMTNENPLP